MIQQYTNIVIPLGNGSCHDNFELRMALRSIEKYANDYGRVFIISDDPPPWLHNVEIIVHSDRHKHNKDANIIEKLLTAADREDLSINFLFWSDDQLALQHFNCRKLLPVYNNRSKKDFSADKIWHKRMINTFEHLEKNGKKLFWNWESHVPQPMNKNLFKRINAAQDHLVHPGLGVNTFYFGMLDTPPQIVQEKVKFTVEKAVNIGKLPQDKLFLGYNNAALQGDLKELLQQHFPYRSSFESF